MSLLQFKALTVEVAGTLIDVERGMLHFLRQAAPASRVRDEEFLRACRDAHASPLALYFPDDLERVWAELARAFALPRDAAPGFRVSVAQWPAFADSVAALRRLQKHYRLVAATNMQQWAVEWFERTLCLRFDAAVTCDHAGCEKPDPHYFVRMKELLAAQGIAQAQTLHVGHSQAHDIRIAQAHGWRTCWIERRCGAASVITGLYDRTAKADWHFRNLRELADAVDAEAAHRARTAAALEVCAA